MFLVANVLFFISASFLPVVTFDTPLSTHLSNSTFGPVATQMIRDRFAADSTLDYARFETRFNYSAEQQAKSLVILFAPLFALTLALLRARRREAAGIHVVFAVHFVAFSLLLFIAVGIALQLAWLVTPVNPNSIWIPLLVDLLIIAWLVPALRLVYRGGWTTAFVQALVMAVLYIPFLGLFRTLLFFTAYYST